MPEEADGQHRWTTTSEINDDELVALQDERDALADERDTLLRELEDRSEEARERWVQRQIDETGLKAADFRNGMSMEVEPAREMVAHWVGAARAMLGDAPNYSETPVEMEVKVAESPERFAFVLQRVAPGALTPHQARQRAEQETAALAAAVRRLAEDLTNRPGLSQSVIRERLLELVAETRH